MILGVVFLVSSIILMLTAFCPVFVWLSVFVVFLPYFPFFCKELLFVISGPTSAFVCIKATVTVTAFDLIPPTRLCPVCVPVFSYCFVLVFSYFCTSISNCLIPALIFLHVLNTFPYPERNLIVKDHIRFSGSSYSNYFLWTFFCGAPWHQYVLFYAANVAPFIIDGPKGQQDVLPPTHI